MQEKITSLTSRLGPVLSLMLAALCLILGIIILIKPQLVAWLIGIGLILAAVAFAAQVFTGGERTDWMQ